PCARVRPKANDEVDHAAKWLWKKEDKELSMVNRPKRKRETILDFPTRNTARYAKYRVEGFMPPPL
ncbi:MAG TPA: hypothetical protein VFV61_09210, partial [Pyrinomonadaceae bacterium]|nr:hypothetical protein [Pyrinomonadaceae bacterium]